MSFGSGTSAFGAKPATSFGTLGSTQTQGVSLFGTPLGQNPNQLQNQTPAQGSSLFGTSLGQNPNQPQNQPAQGTSLFGNPLGQNANQQMQAPTQGTSLFGTPLGQNPNQHAPSQGTSLFGTPLGQNPNQQQNQNQASTQGTSLFGTPFGQNNNQQQQNQPAQGTSLFGTPLGQNPNQQQQSGGLFGNTTTQQPSTSLFSNTNTQQQPSGGLFGLSNQQRPALGGSLFNNTQQNNASTGLFGPSTNTGGQSTGLGSWGSSTTQPGQSTLGPLTNTSGGLFGRPQQPSLAASQTAGQVPFTRSTKFNDLPDNVKKIFEDINSHIQGRVQISNDLKQRKLGEEAVKGQDIVRGVHKELVNAITTLHSDVMHTRDLKAKVDQTVQDTIVATRIVDGFRNPQQHGAYLKNHASFPYEFFQRMTEQMRERLRWYKTTIEQIERKLSSAAAQSQATPQAISSTLEAQHATFVALANKTAALDAELQKIKALYTQLWRAKTGSMRDPFYELDRTNAGDFGIESLNAK